MLFLFIARTLISAIFKTILCETIMTDMACLYLPIHRADIGVYAKNRKNVNQQWKRNWNICSLRVMAKTKLSSKCRPFPFLVVPSLYFCKGNRKTQRVNFIPNFWFFCPLPPNDDFCVTLMYRQGASCVTVLYRHGASCVTVLYRQGASCVTVLYRHIITTKK